jgi:hypothetical protein
LPEIVIEEDKTYTSPIDWVSNYITDVDTDMSEVTLDITSPESRLAFGIDHGKLIITPDENYNGVAYATVTATDGMDTSTGTFRVIVRSMNDKPTIVVENVFEGMLVDDLLVIRGTSEDVEKNLKSVQIAIVEGGSTVFADDWNEVSGAYIWNYMFDIRNFDDGEYSVHIRAYDGDREFSDEFVAGILVKNPKQKVDLTPPTVTIETQFSGVLKDTIPVTGTVSDESGYIEFVETRIDSGSWKRASIENMDTWSTEIITRSLENVEHTFTVRAYDGKAYSVEKSAQFIVDNPDSDLDGVKNVDEREFGMDPFNPIDGPMDYDSDGWTNAVEINDGSDIFDPASHPKDVNADKSRIDPWAIVMIVVAVLFALVIIGLFVANLTMDHRIHKFREELNERRTVKKPKTLLQKIAEIAPTYKPNVVPLTGPALGGPAVQQDNLPPAPENLNK